MVEFRRRCLAENRPPLSGVAPWMNDLLQARGIDTEEKKEKFLHPSLEDLHDPLAMRDLGKAVGLIRAAIARGDRILIYGDYDVDGFRAVTVLLETLREEGANASFRIPSRHSEGYGLNLAAVEEIAGEYQMLITVDCGISNLREVQRAKELGMTVIVTDHHEVPDVLPPADAVLDPLLGDYPFRRLCGAGVALKICQQMQGLAGVKKRIEIAALATVADLVPLVDENRVIVREGMARMEHTSRPGLRKLMELAGTAFPMRSDDIAFRLGPRLNAAGRLGDAARGVRLLTAGPEDAAEAEAIGAELDESNRQRQRMEEDILKEAEALFPEQADLRRDRAVVLLGEDWNPGLIGLAAGKICEKYHHPTAVLTRKPGEDRAVGSCRSVKGINIWEMLCGCGDLLERYGGHELAAGLTIPLENLPAFRERLNAEIREKCDDRSLIPVQEYDTELSLSEVTLDLVRDLETLEPTGFGNPPAVFLTKGASVQEARRVGRDRTHLKIRLLEGAALRDGIGFGLGAEADKGLTEADVLFRPTRNVYNGRESAQLQLTALRPSDAEQAADGENLSVFRALLQEMSLLASNETGYGGPPAGLRPEHLLKERMAGLDFSLEELREIYRRLRGAEEMASLRALAEALGLSEERTAAALAVFQERKLLAWQAAPFRLEMVPRPAKCDILASPLLRYVRKCNGGGA